MTWTLRIRGASSQPIVQEFACPEHGRFTATAPRDTDAIACLRCGLVSSWVISAPVGYCDGTTVVRGKVAAQECPTWMDTRPLAEGMSMQEWRARRDKVWAEKRHKEAKEL